MDQFVKENTHGLIVYGDKCNLYPFKLDEVFIWLFNSHAKLQFYFYINHTTGGYIWNEENCIIIKINQEHQFHYNISQYTDEQITNNLIKQLMKDSDYIDGDLQKISLYRQLKQVFNPLKHQEASIVYELLNQQQKNIKSQLAEIYDVEINSIKADWEEDNFGMPILKGRNHVNMNFLVVYDRDNMTDLEIGELYINNSRVIKKLRHMIHHFELTKFVTLIHYLTITIVSDIDYVRIYIDTLYTIIPNSEYYATIGEFQHKLNVYSSSNTPYNVEEFYKFINSTFNMDIDEMKKEEIVKKYKMLLII